MLHASTVTLEKPSTTVLWQWPSLRLPDNASKTKSYTEPSERRPRPFFPPHKYQPKRSQYTDAQAGRHNPAADRGSGKFPPAGRCWIAQGSLPARTWLFYPRDPTRGCCSLAGRTHTRFYLGRYEIPYCSTYLCLFRSLSPLCCPVSFSKNPPFLSVFVPRHHFSSSRPSGYRKPQNLGDKAVLSFQ